MRKLFKPGIGFATLVTTLSLHAQTPAIQSFTGGLPSTGADVTFGWDFTINNDITVTKLGFYAPGLVSSSLPVGLWTSSGSLLGQATITASGLNNGFYYTALPSGIALIAGQSYLVGALIGNNDFVLSQTTAVVASPAVTYLHSTLAGGAGLTAPIFEIPALDSGFFGPNFEFTTTPVPEPSTYAAGGLLLLSFGAGTFRTLRKKLVAQTLRHF